MNQIVVRNGKGKKDRITVLPEGVKPALKEHLVYVKQLHQSIWTQDTAEYIYRMRLPENIRTPTDNGGGSMRSLLKRCRKIQDPE